jgi:hypothetical protein
MNLFRVLGTFAAEGETFLSRIFTPGETRVHHFEPETKSIAEYGTVHSLPGRKKF